MTKEFYSFFLGGLLGLITIVNPLTKIPIFVSLTAEMSEAHRRSQARKACVYAFWILVVSLFAGALILDTFGISNGALRIAGGLTVLVIGYEMLFRRNEVVQPTAPASGNIAFFPLALPSISGPGSIAVMIGISTEIHELGGVASKAIAYTATLLSVLITCWVVWLVLRFADRLSQFFGQDGMEAFSRMMGFLLVCVGVQFIGSGVRTFIAHS